MQSRVRFLKMYSTTFSKSVCYLLIVFERKPTSRQVGNLRAKYLFTHKTETRYPVHPLEKYLAQSCLFKNVGSLCLLRKKNQEFMSLYIEIDTLCISRCFGSFLLNYNFTCSWIFCLVCFNHLTILTFSLYYLY